MACYPFWTLPYNFKPFWTLCFFLFGCRKTLRLLEQIVAEQGCTYQFRWQRNSFGTAICILACAEIQEAFWNELNWMIRAGMFHHLYLHSAKLCPRLPVEINPGPDERCQQVGQDKQIQFQCVKQLTKQEGLRFLASFNYLIAPSKITTPICFLSNGLEYLQSNSCLYRRCFPSCWGRLNSNQTWCLGRRR